MEHNLQKYIAFCKAVEEKSLTKAGEILNYSQSSMSKMIADLEGEWEIKLLERSRRGVLLTGEGELLLPHIQKIIGDFAKLEEEIGKLRGIEKGYIRIGVFSSVATHWMPNIIKAFQKAYPNVEYELLMGDYHEIEEWIDKGRIEGGFVTLPIRKDLDVIFLEEDPLVVILPPTHPLAAKKIIDPQDLEGEDFMLLERGYQSEVSLFLDGYQIKPNIKFTSWDDYAIMAMVEKGAGIGILPSLILERIPYRIESRPLSVAPKRQLAFATRKNHQLSTAMTRFLDYLGYRR